MLEYERDLCCIIRNGCFGFSLDSKTPAHLDEIEIGDCYCQQIPNVTISTQSFVHDQERILRLESRFMFVPRHLHVSVAEKRVAYSLDQSLREDSEGASPHRHVSALLVRSAAAALLLARAVPRLCRLTRGLAHSSGRLSDSS